MIKYLKYGHIDKAKWDDCINRSFNGMIFLVPRHRVRGVGGTGGRGL